MESNVLLKEIEIDETFDKLLPSLSEDEYEILKQEIKKQGVLNPIILWKKTIVDGHNRYRICKEFGTETIPCKSVDFNSKEDVIEWMLKNQLGRRNLNDFSRIKIAQRYKDIIQRKAKERQSLSCGQGIKVGSNDPTLNRESHYTRNAIAEIANTSPATVERSEYILKHGTDEQIERAEKGGKGNSVSTIANEIKREKSPNKTNAEFKICSKCKRKRKASDFKKGCVCRECYNSYNLKMSGISDEIKSLTYEDVVGDLYDTEKETTYGSDELYEEIYTMVDSFISGINRCLKIHNDILKNESGKSKVLKNLDFVQTKVQEIKDLYSY